MRTLLALLLLPALAFAQTTTNPTCTERERCEPASAGPVLGGGSSSTSGGGNAGYIAPKLPADAPLKSVPNVGGIGNGGEALLLVAVVVLAVLPIVVYSVDAEAPPEVQERWGTFNADVRLLGGGTWTPPLAERTLLVPSMGVRGALGWKALGADASLRTSGNSAAYSWDVHGLIRIPPKQHIELSVALGYRSVYFLGTRVSGFEAALPHEYVFWRSGPIQRFGLELRPAILVGPPNVDLRIDGAFVIPIAGPVTARMGGNVYSFGHDVRGGFEGGLAAQL